MRLYILILLALILILSQNAQSTNNGSGIVNELNPGWHKIEESDFIIYYQSVDSVQAEQIHNWVKSGYKSITDFFENEYKQKFDIFIFSDRDSLDKQWQADWNAPGFKSQCWMVASGVAHRLDILSPGTWPEQACEHDISDTAATKNIIVHELVHVFHGQYNASPTFDNIENIDWFVEGVAVFLSGQLSEERYNRAKEYVNKNDEPKKLADIWKGENRYGLAGSMVDYIHNRYGTKMLFDLLKYSRADEILRVLNVSEEELIENWKLTFG